MLGINFFDKLDSRKLMLDYSFEGNPLLKQFSSIGYDELEYDLRER
jgi:NADH:ubiquinone oxidoreductase subunit C